MKIGQYDLTRQLSPAILMQASWNGGLIDYWNENSGKRAIQWLPGQPFHVDIDFLQKNWRNWKIAKRYIGAKLNRTKYHFAIRYKDRSTAAFAALGYPIGHYTVGFDDLLIFEI